jgi:DNA-binding GntR family transcriptional regulator
MPLAENAYTQLRNLILSGQLPPDSAITENAIVEKLAIGKTPVREAMRRLVLEGLLDVTPRLGYTVVGISQRDVDDIFQLRVILEVGAAQLAAASMTPEVLDRLQALSTTGYDPDDPESIERYAAMNAEFHDIIATLSGNRRLAELITRLMLESRRFIQIAQLTPEHGREVVVQHAAIVQAFRSGDRDAVRDAVRLHIEDSWNVVLDSLSATSGSPGSRSTGG